MTYQPFEIIGQERPSRWVVTCDHASNHVPDFVNGGDLGLPAAEMTRHIAYDVGAAGVTRELSRLLHGPAVLSHFSRLVIDPNRGPQDPTILMKLYDGTIIPGNRHADRAEMERRKAACYDPYHEVVSEVMSSRLHPVMVAVHSFTPRLNGHHPRPWEIGILHAGEDVFNRTFIARLKDETDLTIGDNEPYAGHLPGDSVDRHALRPGYVNTLIELRQDEIDTEEGQIRWARRLAPILQEVLEATGL